MNHNNHGNVSKEQTKKELLNHQKAKAEFDVFFENTMREIIKESRKGFVESMNNKKVSRK